ncbi:MULTISPECIES: hypothetical protein [unclassified Pseudomonas]|uniref:hypothetical protein n=1 Tax=unclassified Pseudomonas TaxID=196821 RepID=UPI00106845D5|nr:hypothetical protein [Pseudomonas sp. SXM-1]QBQ11185.1 hypothetical protein DCC84_16265 [Pseudomonas sp. SXM-1]
MDAACSIAVTYGVAYPLIFVVGWLLSKLIDTRLKGSVGHEYNLKFEKYKEKEQARQKAALVAELIAEWASHPEEQRELNRLSAEAFLWLPSGLAKDLSDILSIEDNAPSPRKFLSDVRNLLLDGDPIDPNLIIFFSQEAKRKASESKNSQEP